MPTAAVDITEPVVLSESWNQPVQIVCKRIVDVVLSLVLLVLSAPLMLVLGILVKLTSAGPVFYSWKVVGKNGRPFIGYKIRSMVVNADELKPQLENHNEMSGPVFKIASDPRVTPLGAWMRRYSLDELPQLYSVFKGDMSLVGPRPPLRTEYKHFTEYQKQKLAVKPGITCLWQISGRNDVSDFNEWVRLDFEYMRRWSMWLDLQILVRTCGAVFSGSGK
jgi:lipopolysaccharide/colanic/teichoic acid biosynthesis glycosyltransferase